MFVMNYLLNEIMQQKDKAESNTNGYLAGRQN
jgi:hypothetical protein